MHDGAPLTIDLPPSVRAVLARLAADGLEAALVGGSVRDLVTGATPTDWDVATAAPPERVAALFPGSSWENRFGTVTVRGDPDVQVTTYRHEGPYLDRRRPEHVRWGTALADDLARRDFTVNAIAWRPARSDAGAGTLVDPYDGIGDLRARRAASGGGSGRTLRRGRPAHGASGALRDRVWAWRSIRRPRRRSSPTPVKWRPSPASVSATSCCACCAPPRRPHRHRPRWP